MLSSRPQMPFSEVQAQERAIGSLRAALRRGTLHHAYLFGGPAGVGKALAARLLAQAANCEGGAALGDAARPDEGGQAAGYREDPCGACRPCLKIAHGTHPDVLVLAEEREMVRRKAWEPEGGRTPSKEIVVAQIRDLTDHRLAMRRFEGRRRFVIVDPADAMNAQAQNALLKTLEEPPEDTTLVLVSASPDALLATVRSRCLRISFAPPPAVQAPLASELAASIRAAAALEADRPLAWLGYARSLGREDGSGSAGEDGADREQVAELGQALLAWWRDVLAVQAGGAPLLGELAAETGRVAAALTPREALRRRAGVERLLGALRQNAAGPLAVERMLIGWFHGL